MDNNKKSERLKEQIYWNCFAYDNLYSLVQLFDHYQKPSKYTQRDYDWRDFFFTNQIHINGKRRPRNFIYKTFDKVAYYQTQIFDLNMLKYDFWNKILRLRSSSQENHKSKQEVKKVLMSFRLPYFAFGLLFAAVINLYMGIGKLSYVKQLLSLSIIGFSAEYIMRIKMSQQIFYRIPPLPNQQLQRQRIQIINECLVFDGTINNYDQIQTTEYRLLNQFLNKNNNQNKKQQILQVLGYNIITKQNL